MPGWLDTPPCLESRYDPPFVPNALVYTETDIEEAYQNAIELTTALNNRQGKAIPVRLRGIIGTVDRVATTLRDLYTALRVHSIEERRHIEDPPRGPVTRSEIRRRGFRRIRK